ncbi:unnamed protein product [Leptidea sinapis]|uniref:[histone H3]-lysine(36) N-trimethyltransferase n=1 Tax=Leptidea sinapis TaxID=189913 RepID=A0A5E4QQG1_9NEOP|nr:unnamed protein product [Leptidea sinapis]
MLTVLLPTMAKKRKPATTVGSRRSARRGKAAAYKVSHEGESSASTEPLPTVASSEEPPPETSNTEIPPSPDVLTTTELTDKSNKVTCNMSPTVVLHKKFGKYRCLFNNDESNNKKYDLCSDSETSSSVEARAIDPSVGSESDSNALDTQSDTNSGACPSPMPVPDQILSSNINSRDPSPIISIENLDIPLPSEDQETDKYKNVDNTNVIPEQGSSLNITGSLGESKLNQLNELSQYCYSDDDEVITVVQIVEDENEEAYYNINIDSPKDQELGNESNEKSYKEQHEHTQFQRDFEKLRLSQSQIVDLTSALECSDSKDSQAPQCTTPDMQYTKDIDMLTRPDPSLTPSSTISDDSNSSRIIDQHYNNSNDSSESSPSGVRRSSRIKTISTLKQKTKGFGLVKTPLKKALITQTKLKLEEMGSESQDKCSDVFMNQVNTTHSNEMFPIPSEMPVKVKSRWRRSSELEMGAHSPAISPLASPNLVQRQPTIEENQKSNEDEKNNCVTLTKEAYDKIIEERMNQFQHLEENEYLCERMISRDTKKMICDCFLTKDEVERGELACGEDCLNRLLMIECNTRCPVGERCTNRRFEKRENAPLEVFYADKKGCGVEASRDIPVGEFLMEYVGEVLDYELFYKRAQAYSDENNLHHYFMSLKGDTVIDATMKGNISRFINHSCEPNAETQKWTVNGELRIGFFSKRDIMKGEEITFDYQFQRFGKVAQRCYCGAENCRGWIGAEPDSDDEYDEEEEDVSTTKSETTELSQIQPLDESTELPQPQPRKPKRERKYKPKTPDLVQDADARDVTNSRQASNTQQDNGAGESVLHHSGTVAQLLRHPG